MIRQFFSVTLARKSLLFLLALLLPNEADTTKCPVRCECGAYGDEGLYVECRDVLTAIPADIPEETTLLIFTQNQITTLPEGRLQHLRNVQTIEFIGNPISNVSWQSFRDLFALTELTLKDSAISSLPPKLFTDSTNLADLSLKHGKLTSLPGDLLQGLSKLNTFDVSSNELPQLPAGLFSDTSNLNFLFVEDNKLTAIADGQFGQLQNLRQLKLGGNKIAAIGDSAFSSMRSLSHLNLENNELTTFPVDQLEDLSALEGLNLDGNKLTVVPIEARGILDRLSQVRLSRNPFVCNKGLQWLQSWAGSNDKVEDIDSVTCRTIGGDVVKLMEHNFTAASGAIGHINVTAGTQQPSAAVTMHEADVQESTLTKKQATILYSCLGFVALVAFICVLLCCFRKKIFKKKKQIKDFYKGNYNKVNRVV